MNSRVRPLHPGITESEEGNIIDKHFRSWFYNYVDNPTIPIADQRIIWIAKGPSRIARAYTGYLVQGYRFQTKAHSVNRATNNSGVCIKGQVFGNNAEDFYGIIDEIIELQFAGPSLKRTIVFNCTWFETTRRGGVRNNSNLKIVEVNRRKHMHTQDRFVLAQQAIQVYYLNYPAHRRDLSDWLVVCKVRPMIIDDSLPDKNSENYVAFQEDEVQNREIDEGINSDTARLLNDASETLFDEGNVYVPPENDKDSSPDETNEEDTEEDNIDSKKMNDSDYDD